MADNAPWWQAGLKIFWRLSIWITFPVVIGAVLGQWLDQKYQTKPWLFLATIGLAFAISMFGLVKNAAKEFEKINQPPKNDGGRQDHDRQSDN